VLEPPTEPDERDWIGVTAQTLPVDRALAWASQPSCGAVVTFSGTVRDHSDGRPGVTALEYEAYPDQAVRRLHRVAEAARNRWPMVGRLVLLHRVGLLRVGETSVTVVTSTPHRAEAFAAAEYCIDTLKRSVPIWKRETWAGGTEWSACSHDIEEVDA
jgi:molybdopterin synthase catalytic subunit